jgi:sec-independent protein translocase protein TatA
MEALTPGHLLIILIAFVLLVGYKKLPEASRSIGRSLRIFRNEMRVTAEPAGGEFPAADDPAALKTADSAEALEAEAAEAERQAVELRARAAATGDHEPHSV